jgi:hypothetical protein
MSDLTLDNLPDMLTTDDMAKLLRKDVDAIRHQIRKHSEILKPFKFGRETRIMKEDFEMYISLLQQQKLS